MKNQDSSNENVVLMRPKKPIFLPTPQLQEGAESLPMVLLGALSGPRAGILLDFHQRWNTILQDAPGSRSSSFSWRGGYLSHIKDTIEIAKRHHPVLPESSGIDLEEALIVLYFHDIERPVLYARSRGLQIPDGVNETDLGVNSMGRISFYSEVLPSLGIELNKREFYALKFFHEFVGVRAADQSGEQLAGFCRMCDVYSHRATGFGASVSSK
jgi:hypothetical protein